MEPNVFPVKAQLVNGRLDWLAKAHTIRGLQMCTKFYYWACRHWNLASVCAMKTFTAVKSKAWAVVNMAVIFLLT